MRKNILLLGLGLVVVVLVIVYVFWPKPGPTHKEPTRVTVAQAAKTLLYLPLLLAVLALDRP